MMSSIIIPDPAITDWVPLGYGASVQSNVPSCRVGRTGVLSIPTGTWTTVPFDFERWDTDNMHDIVTNNSRLICRTAGKYLVTGSFAFPANATGIRGAGFYVTSQALSGYVGLVRTAATSDGEWGATPCVMLDLVVGDYVEAQVIQQSGGALNLAGGSYGSEVEMTYIGPGLLGRGQQNLVGTYALRPAANTVPPGTTYFATDALGTWLSDGNQWFLISQRPAYGAPSMLGQVPWSTPYEGMEVLLTDSYSVPTYAWHMRYNSQSGSAYKWEFIGGWPFVHVQSAQQTLGSTNVWTNLSPSGWPIPRSGDWDLVGSCNTVGASTASSIYFGIYANTPGNNYINSIVTNSASWWSQHTCQVRSNIGAGVNIAMCGYGQAGAVYQGGMNVKIIPARIQ